jgi:hypothetical protein
MRIDAGLWEKEQDMNHQDDWTREVQNRRRGPERLLVVVVMMVLSLVQEGQGRSP